MTYLITGATGAIGRHIVDELLAAGAPVRALTRSAQKANLPANVELVQGDLEAADPQDTPRHAAQVIRRVLLRRNIVIDAETAQLVAAGVQTALQTDTPSRPPRRAQRVPAAGCEPLF